MEWESELAIVIQGHYRSIIMPKSVRVPHFIAQSMYKESLKRGQGPVFFYSLIRSTSEGYKTLVTSSVDELELVQNALPVEHRKPFSLIPDPPPPVSSHAEDIGIDETR